MMSRSRSWRSCAAERPKNCSAAGLTARNRSSASKNATATGSAESRTEALGAGVIGREKSLGSRLIGRSSGGEKVFVGRRIARFPHHAAGDERLEKTADQLFDLGLAFQALDIGPELRRARKAAHIPTEVLAGEAEPGLGSIVR